MAREMKDSGIEWIGNIPTNWELIRTKNRFQWHKDIVGDKADEYERLALTLQGVIKRSKEDNTGLQPEAFVGYQILRAGELVFKLIDLENVSTSRVGLSPYTGIVSPAYIVLTPQDGINPIYAQYFFLSMWQREVFNHMGDDGVRSSLNAKDLLNVPLPCPSEKEQACIADFLNKQCAEIDLVIVETQRTIEEYKKLKQSIITEAVTKGVRGSRTMKNSGVEWIDEVPEEWECVKIGRFFTLRNEKNTLSEDQVQLLSLYTGIGVFPQGEHYTASGNHAQTVEGYKIVKKNDIVVNIILAWMGAMGVSDYDGVTSPAYDVYIPNLEKVLPRFYHYVFRTAGMAGECYKYGRGIMMMRWRTYSNEFKQIKVPYPPIEEQQLIADYLDEKCSEIDAIIAKKNTLLEKLESYKKSVIYEYVTGKKEVPACQ